MKRQTEYIVVAGALVNLLFLPFADGRWWILNAVVACLSFLIALYVRTARIHLEQELHLFKMPRHLEEPMLYGGPPDFKDKFN